MEVRAGELRLPKPGVCRAWVSWDFIQSLARRVSQDVDKLPLLRSGPPSKLSEDLGLNQWSDIQGNSEPRVLSHAGGEEFGDHFSKGL